MKKNILFYILTMAIASLGLAVLNMTSGQELSSDTSENLQMYTRDFCFGGKFNEMDSDDVIEKYKEITNTIFNRNIERIMSEINYMDPVPSLDDYDEKDLTLCNDESDVTCRTLAVCKGNNSAYCVGVNALGFDGRNLFKYNRDELDEDYSYLKYSYFCLKNVLEAKLDDIEEATGERILAKCDTDSEFKDETICEWKEKYENENDREKKADYKRSLDLLVANTGHSVYLPLAASSVSNRANQIKQEIESAKMVLDITLEAYSQLQTAWKMHVKYIDIYNSLVDYRDKLVEIRKQTDVFPLRFIDASTTRCS